MVEVQIIVPVLVVVVQLLFAKLPLNGKKFRHLSTTDKNGPFVGALNNCSGDADQMAQFFGQYLFWEKPLGGEVKLSQPVVSQMKLKELSKFGQASLIGNHSSFLEGRVVGEIYSFDGLGSEPSELRGCLVVFANIILFEQAVVILQESSTPGQSIAHKRNVMIVQADIFQSLWLRVQVEFTFLSVLIVFYELGPFLEIGLFSFDEVGEVGRYHRHHIFYFHLIHDFGQEQTMIFLFLNPSQEYLPARVELFGFLASTVVQFFKHKPVRDIHIPLARFYSRLGLILGQVVKQVLFDNLCFLLLLD